MRLFTRKRPTLEKINNVPVTVEVGLAQKEKLQLREPLMLELLEFIENCIGDLVPVYQKNIKQLDRIAERGTLSATDISLLKPAYVPICDFIAQIADRKDLKGKLHGMLTPTQFTACFNAFLYLVDLPVLWSNFTDALTRVNEARKATKRSSLAH